MIYKSTTLKIWSKRGFICITYIFLVGFAAVLPIDSIAQASQSSNNALNTFIVVGALVIFVIVCIVVVAGRTLYFRRCLQDIPRKYIPITAIDLPHRSSRELILQNMENSKKLSNIFNRPKDPVIHAGMEPPARCDDPSVEKIFPEYLNYGVCIKMIADRLKYKGIFISLNSKVLENDKTFSDLVMQQFRTDRSSESVNEKAIKLIEIYETVRFSGDEITRDQFLKFVEYCIYLMEETVALDENEVDISKIRSAMTSYFDDTSLEKDISRIQSRCSANTGFNDKVNNLFINRQLSSLFYPKSKADEISSKRTSTSSLIHNSENNSIRVTAPRHRRRRSIIPDTASFDTVIHY